MAGKVQLPPYERFMAKVDASGGDAACHLWTGGRTRRGYGQFTVSSTERTYAHRWALSQELGRPLTRKEYALHRCDNPPCVNPAHLYVGDQLQNIRDCVERGRHRNPIADENRTRTSCRRGHEFTPENTILADRGRRQCRTCHNLLKRLRRQAASGQSVRNGP